MRAVVLHGVGDIRIEDVPEPELQEPTDAIVRLTLSAICGTDLHLVRGTLPGMKPGTILGHEGVGLIEQTGREVRNLAAGDRVVVAATLACGDCAYCRYGYYAQCDRANPGGSRAGTAYFGGPEEAGAFDGLLADMARVPFASVGCVKLPEEISDEQGVMLSDIMPTGWFAADLARVRPGATVAVFGCGPVGQMAIAACRTLDAGRIFAVDSVPDRLEMARQQGAETVDFEEEDPVETLVALTHGIGVDRAIDAVGVDATHAHHGRHRARQEAQRRNHEELREMAPEARRSSKEERWHPGDAPSQALSWSVDALCKAGTLGIVGAYPAADRFFPIGKATGKNIQIRTGSCHHRAYIPKLMQLILSGVVDPAQILTQRRSLDEAVEAFHAFDRHQQEWVKVALEPQTAQ